MYVCIYKPPLWRSCKQKYRYNLDYHDYCVTMVRVILLQLNLSSHFLNVGFKLHRTKKELFMGYQN